MNTTVNLPVTVGHFAAPRFMQAIDQAELVTGCRIEIIDPRRRLFSTKLVLRVTGPARMIGVAGRIMDQVIGR